MKFKSLKFVLPLLLSTTAVAAVAPFLVSCSNNDEPLFPPYWDGSNGDCGCGNGSGSGSDQGGSGDHNKPDQGGSGSGGSSGDSGSGDHNKPDHGGSGGSGSGSGSGSGGSSGDSGSGDHNKPDHGGSGGSGSGSGSGSGGSSGDSGSGDHNKPDQGGSGSGGSSGSGDHNKPDHGGSGSGGSSGDSGSGDHNKPDQGGSGSGGSSGSGDHNKPDHGGSGGSGSGGSSGSGDHNKPDHGGSGGGGSGIVTDAPVSTIDPEAPNQAKARGAISDNFDIGAIPGTCASSINGQTWTLNVGGKDGTGLNTGILGFYTDSNADGTGFALNMKISAPLKYVSFGGFNSNIYNSSPVLNAFKLLFGDDTTTSSFIDKDWFAANLFQVPTETENPIQWKVDTIQYNDHRDDPNAFELQVVQASNIRSQTSTTGLGKGTSQAFKNKKELVWEIENPEQDQTLIKTSYVNLYLVLKNASGKTEKICIPINFNVIYEYKAQENIPTFTTTNSTIVNTANGLAGGYIQSINKNHVPGIWEDKYVKNWQLDTIGSDRFNNIINVRVDKLNYAKIALLALTEKELIGQNKYESIISYDWLVQKGFALGTDTRPNGITIGWSTINSNNALTVSVDSTTGRTYISTTNNIDWNKNQQASIPRASVQDTPMEADYVKPIYEQYVSYRIDMTISKGTIFETVPIELRIVQPSSPFINSGNLLTKDYSGLLVGSKVDTLAPASPYKGNVLSFKSAIGDDSKATISMESVVSLDNDVQYFAIKKFSLQDLIKLGVINTTWLKQKGFDPNTAKLTWSGVGGTDPLGVVTTDPSTKFSLQTKTINGVEYFVLDLPISSSTAIYDAANVTKVQTINFGLSIQITDGNKEPFIINFFSNVSIPPFASLRADVINTTMLKNTFKSSTGIIAVETTFKAGGTDVVASTGSAANTNNELYVDQTNGTILKLTVKSGTAKYFAFRLPNEQDLFNKTNGLINKELAKVYGLVADTIDPLTNKVKAEGNIKSISWIIEDKISASTITDLGLITIPETDLGASAHAKPGQYITNRTPLGAESGLTYGIYELVYKMSIEKDDGTIVSVPITISININY